MATAVDVAAFIRAAHPGLSRMKLLKLVYYAQAWALAWDRAPLFSERIEAWAEGPVVRSLWAKEKHGALVEPNADTLTSTERDTVRAVLAFYADFNGEDLSEITHVEKPWHDAREGIPHGEKSQGEITVEAMRTYYGAVKCDGKKIPSSYAKALDHMRDLEPEALADLLALSGPDDDDLDVNADAYCKWLETGGEGDPCPASLA